MIIPAGYSQVSLDFRTDPVGRTASVVFGVANGDGDSPLSIAADVEVAVAPWIENVVSIHAVCTMIRVKNGPNASGPSGELGTALGGDVGGDMISPQVTLLHTKFTALGGRKHRGRLFSPFSSESVVDSLGFVDGTHRGVINDKNEDLLTALAADNHAMVLLHAHGASAPDLVTDLICQPEVATQRRRLRR